MDVLHPEDERLAAIARITPVVLWEADPATFAFTFVSEQAEELLGFPRSEWVCEQRFWRKRVHPDDQPETIRICRAAIDRHEPHALEYRMLAADGRAVWVENHVSCVVEGGVVTKLCGVLFDISQRKLREEARRVSRERAEASAAAASVATLAGGLAHDFNNVLGTILGNVGLAQESMANPPVVSECLAEVERAAERAALMIGAVVAFSRPRPPVLTVVPVAKVVAGSMSALRDRGIALELVDEAPGAYVNADADQLERAIVEITANASRRLGSANPGNDTGSSGVLRLTIEIVRTGEDKSPSVQVSVHDDGPAIDEATLARIFEPSFRRSEDGFGLGLATAHGIVARHGGTMTAESAPGGGNTVTVRLPRATQPPATRSSSESLRAGQREHIPAAGRRGRVFVVDDEPEHVRVVTRLLEREGHEVSTFVSPEAALAAVALGTGDLDLLVTDFNMPKLSGLDLAKKVHELLPGLPIVLMSGGCVVDLEARAKSAGIDRFLAKPVGISDLRAAVCELLTPSER